MHIIASGISHRSAPIDALGALGLARNQVSGALETLRAHAGGGVLIGTCSRTEVYVALPDAGAAHAALDSFVREQFGTEPDEVWAHLYTLHDSDAVRHLFRVTAGLDSLMLGESEVLGQVRDCYGMAAQAGTAKGTLTHLFHHALRVGKRVRTETALGRNPLSVSRACVAMLRNTLGDLSQLYALVLGVGDASRLAAQAFSDAGVGSLTIANRTLSHAAPLAQGLGAAAAPLSELPSLLRKADIVVSSTGAPGIVLTADALAEAMASRTGRALVAVDLAMPRDVDPSAAGIDGVRLYTARDLESVAEANRRERAAEVEQAEAIVEEEVARFAAWWKERDVRPVVAALHSRADAIRDAEVRKTLARLNGAGEESREAIEAMSKALVKRLLHDPTRTLLTRNDNSLTGAARELFGLDEE